MRDMGGQWSDRRVERIVGGLLRTGVVLSAVVVVIGALIFLFQHGTDHFDYKVFAGTKPELCTIGGILHEAFSLHSRGIIQLGLLMLIATPVARVLFSVFAFAIENDKVYVGITIFVLVILLYSITRIG